MIPEVQVIKCGYLDSFLDVSQPETHSYEY